jgi:Domain of unknown function (DUF5668)/Cell wall-active antibiotics response 4TMS YvqF
MPEYRSPQTRGLVAGYAGRADAALGRIVVGLVVVALGVLFTLDNLGVVETGEVLRWWPALLLAYGLGRLTGFCCRQNTVLGTIFSVAGGLLLLHEADLIHLNPWDFWPVILVVIGASMVTGALRRARYAATGGVPGAGVPGAPAVDAASRLNTFVVWAGLERKVTSPDFRGGDVTAIMGGAEIDLRGSKMTGDAAVVDVLVLWGGVDLYVPADWRVTVEALPLMGGIEDATRVPPGEVRGHLILKGVVLMGGVEVKN